MEPHASVFLRLRPHLPPRPFRLVLGGIGPTSGQTNASREMRWVLSRPWAKAFLGASVSGDATVEQLRELKRLNWAQPQLDEVMSTRRHSRKYHAYMRACVRTCVHASYIQVTSTRRRERRAKHKRHENNLTAAHAAWLAAGWTDAQIVWQCFCEDDSAGTGFSHDLLTLARSAGFTNGLTRLTSVQAATAVADYVAEAVHVLSGWPRIRRQARVGYPSTVHSVAPHVDAVLVERSNDDVGSLMPALAYSRGAAWQYELSDGWGVDLSLWWGVIDGCVSDLPASLFRRHMHLSYMAGANTIALEDCGWFRADGTLLPIGEEADAFGAFALQTPPAARGDADVRMAFVVPRHHLWSERPSWDDSHGGRSRWSFANLAATPQTAVIDGLMGWAFPGVGSFGYLAFPFGAFANNTDPPPSPFARSSIGAEYAPDPQDAFAATSDLPLGAFANRHEAADWFRPNDTVRRDPSSMRPMEDTRWGGLIDVLVDDDDAPGGWPRVLGRYRVVLWSSSLTANALGSLSAFVARGGVLVIPAGAAATPELEASLSRLSGIRMISELRAIRAYQWLEGAVGEQPPLSTRPGAIVSEAMLAVAARVDDAQVEVLAASVPEGWPLVVRRRLGQGFIYSCTLPWFKGSHGDLSGLVKELTDRVMRPELPVSLTSGPPTIAFTSSSVEGESRTMTAANNAASVWSGTLRIAPPLGCSTRPRCNELSELSQWTACTEVDTDLSDDEVMHHVERALTVTVVIAAYGVKTLRVSC